MAGTRDLAKLEAQIAARLEGNITAAERKILVNYKVALDSIRVELSKVYEKYAVSGALTHAEMTKYNRLMGLQQQLTGIVGTTLSKTGRLVKNLAENQYEASFFMHGWAIDQAVGVQLKWGLLSEKAVEAAIEGTSWYRLQKIAVSKLRMDFATQIDRTITQGLIQGLSYPKMAKTIKKVADANAAHAITIARTEGQRAAVLGQKQLIRKAQEDLDIDVEEIWDATLDRRTRPEHGERDGKAAVEHDGELMWYVHFPDGGSGWTKGPGLSGNASDSINCRCRIRPQIKDYGPKVRRVRDEGIRDYVTYDDWAAEKGLK